MRECYLQQEQSIKTLPQQNGTDCSFTDNPAELDAPQDR